MACAHAISGVGEFSTRYPVKFSTPAAGYHFHGLTGGEVNFIAIFSDGDGALAVAAAAAAQWKTGRAETDVYFFLRRGDFSAAVLQTRGASVLSVPTCA